MESSDNHIDKNIEDEIESVVSDMETGIYDDEYVVDFDQMRHEIVKDRNLSIDVTIKSPIIKDSEALSSNVCFICGELCRDPIDLYDHNDDDSDQDDDHPSLSINKNDFDKDEIDDVEDLEENIEENLKDNLIGKLEKNKAEDCVIEQIENDIDNKIDNFDLKSFSDVVEKINDSTIEKISLDDTTIFEPVNRNIVKMYDPSKIGNAFDVGLPSDAKYNSISVIRGRRNAIARKLSYLIPRSINSSNSNPYITSSSYDSKMPPTHVRPPPRQPLTYANPFRNVPYSSTLKRDTVQTNDYGTFECPICSNRYMTANYLGEHFTMSHNNYNQQSELDLKPKDGFPGHDVLETIGMYDYVSKTKLNEIIESGIECVVCCRKFNDLDVIQESSDKIDIYSVYPVIMKCCNDYACKECIRLYVSVHHELSCLLCYFNHTVKDTKQITMYENSDTCDKSLWIEWRSKHPL